jgi:hypothetical protein
MLERTLRIFQAIENDAPEAHRARMERGVLGNALDKVAQLGRQVLRRVAGVEPLLQGVERCRKAPIRLSVHSPYSLAQGRFRQKSSIKFNVQNARPVDKMAPLHAELSAAQQSLDLTNLGLPENVT